jgi:signal transduction histidine kinase
MHYIEQKKMEEIGLKQSKMHNINKNSLETKVSKRILIIPILTIIIFSFMILGFLIIYLENFKEDRILEFKTELIQQKKETIKNRVTELANDISNTIKKRREATKIDIKNKVEQISMFANKLIEYNSLKDKKRIKNSFIEFLSMQRYNGGKGYFFAYDRTTGEIKTHAIKRLIGKNVKDLRLKSGESPYARNERVLKKANIIVELDKWEQFKKLTKLKQSDASKELRKFIDKWLEKNAELKSKT